MSLHVVILQHFFKEDNGLARLSVMGTAENYTQLDELTLIYGSFLHTNCVLVMKSNINSNDLKYQTYNTFFLSCLN